MAGVICRPSCHADCLVGDNLKQPRRKGDPSEGDRAQALGSLAPHLPPEQIAEARAAAKAIGDERYRAQALGSLASYISPSQRGVLMKALLEAAARLPRNQAMDAVSASINISLALGGDARRHGLDLDLAPRPLLETSTMLLPNDVDDPLANENSAGFEHREFAAAIVVYNGRDSPVRIDSEVLVLLLLTLLQIEDVQLYRAARAPRERWQLCTRWVSQQCRNRAWCVP
jgi:hypothetical protein